MKFDTIRIAAITFEVEVDRQGQFWTNVDGGRVAAPSFDLLKKALIKHAAEARKNISIPFVCWEKDWNDENGKLVHGVCVGIHAGNNNLLVKYQGDKAAQQLAYTRRSNNFVAPEHAYELEKLEKAVETITKARDKFVEDHHIDLREAVEKALGVKKEAE